jgi:hypothetical protein
LKSYWGKEVSDPVKVAQVVLRLAAVDSLPARLLIGSDAVRFAGEAEKTREAEAAQWRQISLSTDNQLFHGFAGHAIRTLRPGRAGMPLPGFKRVAVAQTWFMPPSTASSIPVM